MSSPRSVGTWKLPAGHAYGQCVRLQTDLIKRLTGRSTARGRLYHAPGFENWCIPHNRTTSPRECPLWRGSASARSGGGSKCIKKELDVAAFAHICSGAAAFRLAGNLVAIGKSAEHDDTQVRHRGRQLLDQGQAAPALQCEVQDEDVGRGFPCHRQHFGGVRHLSDTTHVGLSIDELAHDVAQIAVVLRNQNPYGLLLLQDLSWCRNTRRVASGPRSQVPFPPCNATRTRLRSRAERGSRRSSPSSAHRFRVTPRSGARAAPYS